MTLTETGTHAAIAARLGGYNSGEPEPAAALAPAAAGMLAVMDRGFPGTALMEAYAQAGAHVLIRAQSGQARRVTGTLADGTYLALVRKKGSRSGGITVRVIEYAADGGETARLLTDLPDPEAFPAAGLAALYRERWEAESAFRQLKTFQRGPQEILRSADPALARQEARARLTIRRCLTAIIMRLAAGNGPGPDRVSFTRVLKHVRRTVIRQTARTPAQIGQFLAKMAGKTARKLDNGPRRLREATRYLKRTGLKYSFRTAGQTHQPTRRVPPKVITLRPAVLRT